MIQKLAGAVLFVGLGTALLYGAPQMGTEKAAASETITGCLHKGAEAKGFFLVDSDNKHWELYPESGVALADHVGHTVAVTGTVAHRTAAQEEKSQPFEKKEEAGTKDHADLNVAAVKHVSETCK